MRVLLTQPAVGESWLSHNRLYASEFGAFYIWLDCEENSDLRFSVKYSRGTHVLG